MPVCYDVRLMKASRKDMFRLSVIGAFLHQEEGWDGVRGGQSLLDMTAVEECLVALIRENALLRERVEKLEVK